MTKMYQRLRFTGSKPAILYGLANVHKKDTQLRPILSIPDSSYKNLNRFLTPLFQNQSGAKMEANTQDARNALESLYLEDNEQYLLTQKVFTPTCGLERL